MIFNRVSLVEMAFLTANKNGRKFVIRL